ncbi:hypothetical protein GGI12_006341, partial [Dipsacomyces acuminosporus]
RLMVEERPLKRCLKQFSSVCERSIKLSPGEAARACEQVLREVRWFRHTVQVAVQSQQRCEQEISAYSNRSDELEAQIEQNKAEVKRLCDKLEESRNHKKHKISYDEIAKEANKWPSRDKLQEEIDEIDREIEQLHQEEAAHDLVVESLRAQYRSVVGELNKLEDMSKNALNAQDLGIYLGEGDAANETETGKSRGVSDQNNPASVGISPATPHRHGGIGDGENDGFSTPSVATPLPDSIREGRRKSDGQLDEIAAT